MRMHTKQLPQGLSPLPERELAVGRPVGPFRVHFTFRLLQ